MKHSTSRPTHVEASRMCQLKESFCIACRRIGHYSAGVPEIHHLLSGNKRRGHLYTIALCSWHHRGQHGGLGIRYMEINAGPSLARGSKTFHAFFGTDDELLAATNELLEHA